ncbi:lysozyme inhibitor LprI family protein [Sphingomonas sp. PL-96]|uniref:lysozyme inhibitor LprI family protein n=1 Tax=Sphingomonas sp. PL-96 TaxID=2887201 RepID=UPI001E4A2375|nr:lysozyme inhibitor LprI family protein [Sphingomonas sp. PL-96]MCC2977434.1 lysozyme inhibitor LprI family protein [Sphingomonas sp. PL-96]
MLLIALALATAADDCGDKDNQAAMTMCEKAVADRTDAEMNRVWKTVQASMQQADRDDGGDRVGKGEPSYAQALLASQRAWLAFRDAQCRIASYEWRGGSMEPFAYNQCLAAVTAARTQQLRELLWDH